MTLTHAQLEHLSTLLPVSAILDATHPSFEMLTQTWLHQLQKSPSLVIRPPDTATLSAVLRYLYSDACDSVDFAIRTGGVGNASAKDLLIETSSFNSFSFSIDWEDTVTITGEATVVLGAGQLWEVVDNAMAEQAPGWAVIGARSQYVGIAGYLLMGGLSWNSHAYGMGSDPLNLLDAEVVLPDGRVVWTKEEAPDVLWAMRGGRTAFGVLTRVKLRARRMTTEGILAGNIIYPLSSLAEVSYRVSEFARRNDDPKLALYIYLLNPQSPFFPKADGVGLIVYDAHGLEHARNEQGFKWAFDIEDAQDFTSVMDFREVNQLTNFTLASRGKTHSHYAGGLVHDIDPQLVVRSKAWFDKVLATHPALAAGSFVMIEIMGRRAFGSTQSLSETAYPHSEQRHILQLATGFLPGHEEPKVDDKVAMKLLEEAFRDIPLDVDMGRFSPVIIQPFVDVARMYGGNLDRLKGISHKYDPKARFDPGLW